MPFDYLLSMAKGDGGGEGGGAGGGRRKGPFFVAMFVRI